MQLTRDEIEWFIKGYVAGEIPDYQMSAMTMAICFKGMTPKETTDLTLAMAHSGDMLDWSDLPGIKVDKHSTGGVGDTTTIVLAPLVASLGISVAKMSGRGLGHTGGTIDKLESIPGFSTKMSVEKFRNQVSTIGIAVAGQTADLAPADKKLYALRDVTDTVQSIPLIASSIMSKKLASGADAIVLDVKVGDGAFMKDLDAARKLAKAMVSIGQLSNRETVAVLTQMEQPLGNAIGNALEVREAVMTLRGEGPADLTELCLTLGAEMVMKAGKAATPEAARKLLLDAIADGRALRKWKEFVKAQGGDPRVADDLSLLPEAPVIKYCYAPASGVIAKIRAEEVGLIAMRLGAGRAKHGDEIDTSVGLVLKRKVGQTVLRGEALVEIHAASDAAAEEAIKELAACITIKSGEAFTPALILDVVREGDHETQLNVTSPDANGVAGATSAAPEAQAADPVGLGAASNPAAAITDSDPLVLSAAEARTRAYTPYSHFSVGAALRLSNGTVVSGANVENASYGLTNCAERTAIFAAVTSPEFKAGVSIEEIAVIADSVGPVAPCGACRQVIAEFCNPDTPVVLSNLHGQTRHTTVKELLPMAFGPAQMPSVNHESEEDVE